MAKQPGGVPTGLGGVTTGGPTTGGPTSGSPPLGAVGGPPLGAVGGVGVAADVRQALLGMAHAMHQIGTTARQNNPNFLSDIPYFGIPPAQDKRKP